MAILLPEEGVRICRRCKGKKGVHAKLAEAGNDTVTTLPSMVTDHSGGYQLSSSPDRFLADLCSNTGPYGDEMIYTRASPTDSRAVRSASGAKVSSREVRRGMSVFDVVKPAFAPAVSLNHRESHGRCRKRPGLDERPSGRRSQARPDALAGERPFLGSPSCV